MSSEARQRIKRHKFGVDLYEYFAELLKAVRVILAKFTDDFIRIVFRK